MSGGSFDYVCYDMEDPEWAYRAKLKLEAMKTHCETRHPEAVPYIDDMLQFIHAFNEEYLKKGSRIADLLKSIEWYQSGDWGSEAVEDALKTLKQDGES